MIDAQPPHLEVGDDQALIQRSKPGSGQEPTNIQRRTLIGRALAAGGALAALSASSGGMMAAEKDRDAPNDPFIVLLQGLYQLVPAGRGPAKNLGLSLSAVNLSDGTYSTTKIYPVFGIPESRDQDGAIGNFYVSLTTFKCAYDLPGGALAMQFQPAPAGAPPGYNDFVAFPDGKGGQYDEGTFELDILEATGIY